MSQELSERSPHWRIQEWFQELNNTQLNLLRAYHDDLCKWTKKINLISAGTVNDADRVHFADCILGCGIINKEIKSKSIKDLGSGNGLPGVIFAILNPDIEVECIDSDERKIAFIKQLALRQKITNLKARCVRIEKLEGESIKCGIAKGLGSVKRILELSEGKILPGSDIFLFKGPERTAEVQELGNNFKASWKIHLLGEYQLPAGSLGARESRVILKANKL